MYKSFITVVILSLGLWGTARLQAGAGPVLPAAIPESPATGTPENAPGHSTLAQGVLLIAGKNLLDPHFARSVVLITEYNDEGTLGLVLNRRTRLSADEVLPQLADLAEHLGAIHVGGPVAANHINLLVKSDNVPHGAKKVIDDIFLIDSMAALRELEPETQGRDTIRVYMGVAGWAPGQLETELLRGDWYIWPASSSVIFSKTPENIWYELIYLATAKWT